MAIFNEVDITTFSGGRIESLEPEGLGAAIGLLPGDELLAINDQAVEDVIDVQFYGADEQLELLIRRQDEYLLFEAEREYEQQLGLQFAHPTFDVDIRRCNNLCEFCFVLQMAPRFRRTLYIKDDDYRYSFLFGHFVTLTNLSDHDWWRIETMRLSPLYVSVHVTDLALRRRFLRNDSAPDIMDQLRWLKDRHIDVHTQLVVVPEFNDGEWLERSVRDLETLWAGEDDAGGVLSISVVPVGLTKQHKYAMRPHTVAEAAATLSYVEALQEQYLERFGTRFLYPTDEWYLVTGREVPPLSAYDGQQLQENGLGMVRAFLDEWELVREEIKAANPKQARWPALTLVTATLFASTLREKAAEFAALTGCELTVLPVINERLGETITAAGLLMGGDVVAQLQQSGHGELIILPRVMFDHPDTVALDDLSPQDIANTLGTPVALADSLGDVWDAINGRSSLRFEPGRAPAGSVELKLLPGDAANGAAHFS